MENQVLTEIDIKKVQETKEKLPHNSYSIISERINGKYSKGTIKAMFNGDRTMKPEVFEAANDFLEFIGK